MVQRKNAYCRQSIRIMKERGKWKAEGKGDGDWRFFEDFTVFYKREG